MKETLPKQLIGVRTVIVNYEMEYREKDLDLAICVEITGGLAKSLGYEEKTLTFSGELATLVCKREQLDDGYQSMLSQIHEIDYQIIGASYEIYYEDGTVELKIPVCKKVRCMDPMIERQVFKNDEAAVGKWEIRDIFNMDDEYIIQIRNHRFEYLLSLDFPCLLNLYCVTKSNILRSSRSVHTSTGCWSGVVTHRDFS